MGQIKQHGLMSHFQGASGLKAKHERRYTLNEDCQQPVRVRSEGDKYEKCGERKKQLQGRSCRSADIS